MKQFVSTILIFYFFTSCQKEYIDGNSSVAAGSAIFTLTSPQGVCTNAVVNGIYTAGISLTAANTISIKVNVSSIGAYSITTNTVNGISFSAGGTFTTTGEQTIHLLGTGTPKADGNFSFTIGSNGCTFSITVALISKGTAVFTYHGAPNSCTNVTRGGVYTAGIPLTNLNRVRIDVNVIVPGTYFITTAEINGFSFSASGNFETIGFGTVILQGTGTPVATGSYFFTPSNNGCCFPIFVN